MFHLSKLKFQEVEYDRPSLYSFLIFQRPSLFVSL